MSTESSSPGDGRKEEMGEAAEDPQGPDGERQERREDPQEKNIWERLLILLRIHRGPDTTRELEQEIQDLLEDGEGQGLISSLEEKLITRIFEFRDTLASEIMTPSAEMVCAEEQTTVAELIRIITEEGYTRIPIYRESQDHIIGILHAKDMLRICILTQDEPMGLKEFLNPPFFVSESKPIVDLLRDFQNKKSHLAIVTDEFGGVRGLVTLEDVIEEIVGEIDDEYDEDEHDLRIIDERTVVVKSRLDIEEVETHFDVEFPEGPYESVGGMIIHKLGNVPPSGTVVTEGDLEFRVLMADPRRIRTIRITKKND